MIRVGSHRSQSLLALRLQLARGIVAGEIASRSSNQPECINHTFMDKEVMHSQVLDVELQYGRTVILYFRNYRRFKPRYVDRSVS